MSTITNQITDVLKQQGALTIVGIVGATKLNHKQVSNVVYRLKRDGRIDVSGKLEGHPTYIVVNQASLKKNKKKTKVKSSKKEAPSVQMSDEEFWQGFRMMMIEAERRVAEYGLRERKILRILGREQK